MHFVRERHYLTAAAVRSSVDAAAARALGPSLNYLMNVFLKELFPFSFAKLLNEFVSRRSYFPLASKYW